MSTSVTGTSIREVQQLRRCIRDLVALSALPAVWIGYDLRQIAESLGDVLLRMLHLDLVYLVVREEADGVAAEVARTAQGPVPAKRAREFGRALAPWWGHDADATPSTIADPLGGGSLRIIPTPFEIGGRSGVLVAGARRADFPTEVDRFLLGVGANQAAFLLERRRAEEQLQESQRQLTDFVENASEGLHWLGPDGIILWANKADMDLLGYAREEYIGRHIAEFHADPHAIADIRRRLANRERLHGYEARLRCKDGSIKHVLINSDVLWEGGKYIHSRCFTRDITERKRVEEALRESEERLRLALEAGRLGTWDWNILTGEVTWSRRMTEIHGLPPDTPVRTFEDALRPIHPEDRAVVEQSSSRGIERGAGDALEFRIVWPDGSIRWVEGIGNPVYDEAGRAVRMLGVVTDITERKRAEEALRRERDFAESLINTAQAVVLVLDTAGRIVRFNPYMEQIAGYRLAEVRGRDWSATFVPEPDRPHAREAFIRTLAGAENNRSIHAISTRHRGHREIEWSNKALKDGDGTIVGVLAIGHDITELKEAQQRALQAERLAAIGEMVAGLAHESRNALHRGQVCLEMLAMEVEDRPEAVRLIGRLQQAQNDLYALYEDVRSYAAPIHLDRRGCNLAEIWRAAWVHLEHLRQGRMAMLREESDSDTPDLHCTADPFRLEQVFRNILENSLAACRDPVAILIRCQSAEIDGQRALRVAIRDRGPGLNPEQKRRLFEPFFTTKTKGTGLGMAIARRIVEAHGGRIAIGEHGGPGVEIVLTLPRGQP